MKVLKWIGIIFLVIIGALLILVATSDDNLKVEDSIVIDASADKVFSQVADFNMWNKWSAWSKIDPNMTQEITGDPATVGHKNEWKSDHDQVGNGSQEIVAIEASAMVKSKMLFEGFDNENFATFTLEEQEGGGTKVTWDFLGADANFGMKALNLMIKPAIEASYRQSLEDLKAVVEALPDDIPNPEGLEVLEVEPISIISIRDTTTAAEIGEKLRELYTELSIYMAGHEELEMAGMPMGLYHFYSEEMVDMEAAFPISGEAVNSGRVVAGTTPGGTALKGVHMGDYNASGNMHMAMEEYVNKRSDLEFDKVCWEVYANDPGEVDSADVKTEIYYSLK